MLPATDPSSLHIIPWFGCPRPRPRHHEIFGSRSGSSDHQDTFAPGKSEVVSVQETPAEANDSPARCGICGCLVAKVDA